MLEVLLAIICSGCIFIAYCVGYLRGMDSEDKRLSARVIRPANITVNRHYHVTEYNITDSKALDLDFPETRKIV